MFRPAPGVAQWMIIIYERQQRFNDQVANQMATDLVKGCEAVGMATQNERGTCPPSPGPRDRYIHQPPASAH